LRSEIDDLNIISFNSVKYQILSLSKRWTVTFSASTYG